MGTGTTGQSVTGKSWAYAFLAGMLGLFIAWLIQIAGVPSTDAAKFFTGVLVGMSISALVVAASAYLRERRVGHAN